MNLNIVKIQAEMKRLGDTHESLAERMGVHRQAVTYWLGLAKKGDGGFSLKTVSRFARAFGIDEKDLLVS